MPRPTELRTEPGLATAPSRRTVIKAGGALLLSVFAPVPALAAQILAVRVWPAPDYTRVTLENDSILKTTHFLIPDPHRLVVDIEGLQLNPTLKSLVAKIQPNDPYIKQVRVGQNRPDVVRLVFDLKEEVKPQVFSLEPVGEYKHRLIFDLYPLKEVDPIAEMIEQRDWMDGPIAGSAAAEPVVRMPELNAPAVATGPGVPIATAGPATPPLADVKTDAKVRLPEPKVMRMITVALDPGHGGEDPGAIGRRGSREKDIVLKIAHRLKERLEKLPNVRVMLTRDGDYFVPLGTRVQKARRVQADLFVSIHADAFVRPTARGSSVFVLSEQGASSAAARWLADKENLADIIGGTNVKREGQLAKVLLDLSTTAQISDSLKLGKAVLGEIGGINTLHKASVEQAGFAVLKAPDIPSILVETAFISNPEEEKKLNDDGYQDQIAEAITKGIKSYFAKNPPLAKSRMT